MIVLLFTFILLESNTVTYQLYWRTTEFAISVGDSIEWNWEVDLGVDQELSIQVFETVSHESTIRKDGGFNSMGNSQTFTLTFNEVGTYYFASSNNFNSDLSFGEINVTEPEIAQRRVEVLVGGVAAQYVMASPSSDQSLRKRRAVDCEQSLPSADSDGLTFVYSPCFTPTVFRVTPNVASKQTIFTIYGEQFSTKSNIVTLGGSPCVTLTETETEITCKLSSESSVQPPAYTQLLISVRNTDPGYGNAYIRNTTASTVTLYPLVTSVSPSEGSLEGGTDVILSGATLNFIEVGMEVRIGDGRCVVKSVLYTMIECMTMAIGDDEDNSIQFYLNGEELNYFCNDSNNCTFSFSEDVTPEIDEIYPTVISTPGTQVITLKGENFSSTYDQYSITLGKIVCSITSANSTVIFCEIPSLPAGNYMLQLAICNLTSDGSRCFGNGEFDDEAQMVRVVARVTRASPSIGSIYGETEITLSGSGLSGSSDSIAVTMDGTICDVVSATYEEIVCITSVHSAGIVAIVVTDQKSSVDTGDLMFEFTTNSTPTVTSITPSTGTTGQAVAITGDMFAATVSVTVGGVSCEIQWWSIIHISRVN